MSGEQQSVFPGEICRITSLFLKSHIQIELAEGAELKAFTDREKFPTFPGMLQSYDETDEYNLGTWEGNPLPMFSGIICGIGAEDVVIYKTRVRSTAMLPKKTGGRIRRL